jgi:hypothetical protein
MKQYLFQRDMALAPFTHPYPAESMGSILHWKILSILLAHKNSPTWDNAPSAAVMKKVYVVGSSIIYWAEKRAEKTGFQQLDMK